MSAAFEAGDGFFQRPPTKLSPAEEMQRHEQREGRLREVIEVDRTGRRISRFYGACCFDQFKSPSRFVTGFNIPTTGRKR